MTAVAAAQRPLRSEPTGFVGPDELRRQFWVALKTAHRITESRREPTGFVGPDELRRQFWVALKTAHRITESRRQAFCRRVPRKVWKEDGSVETSLIVVEMRAD